MGHCLSRLTQKASVKIKLCFARNYVWPLILVARHSDTIIMAKRCISSVGLAWMISHFKEVEKWYWLKLFYILPELKVGEYMICYHVVPLCLWISTWSLYVFSYLVTFTQNIFSNNNLLKTLLMKLIQLFLSSAFFSQCKVIYYKLFSLMYGIVGSHAHLAMVNSSWTQSHIQKLWGIPDRIKRVYPPCDTSGLQVCILIPIFLLYHACSFFEWLST